MCDKYLTTWVGGFTLEQLKSQSLSIKTLCLCFDILL